MKNKAWIVAVDMGYGHQRAAYPMRSWSPTGAVITVNNYPGIPTFDRLVWERSRKFYEFVSRLTNWPRTFGLLFTWFDRFQAIASFYPRRDLSKPNLQLRQIFALIKKGWGRHFVDFLNTQDIPLITTFFTVAFFAEEHNFKNDIYCVVTDTDISRTWAPLHPHSSRIKYLAPCRRAAERLQLYGVKAANIFLTGFPLPDENIGGANLDHLNEDLAVRLVNLDPEKRYQKKYAATLKQFLPNNKLSKHSERPLTLTFAVGGAGAQRQLGGDLMKNLRNHILENKININLVAGVRADSRDYFMAQVKKLGLDSALGKNLEIIYVANKDNYFEKFNALLRVTDILWTKPSELVFYSALGLPIVMAPPVGSQEEFNRMWLKSIGGGLEQDDVGYAREWLFDWVNNGWLAEAAMSGFLDGRQYGLGNIAKVVFEKNFPSVSAS